METSVVICGVEPFEHNVIETKEFTLRCRPWSLIRKEAYESKQEVIIPQNTENGKGRKEIKSFITEYLKN
jgi:hypothetical protein